MNKTKNKYKFIAQLNIFNKYLPSPIMVMVGANNRTYINKYFENKILELCKQYNYIGYLDTSIKYIRGMRNTENKTLYVDRNRILLEPPENNIIDEE